MTNLRDKLWDKKYSPKTVEDYVFQNDQYRQQVYQMIEQKHIPHILMSGTQGSGKTTLSFILIDAMNLHDADILVINASDENSIDTIREKVKTFALAAPIGDFKIILLEEADRISAPGQDALRRLMDECDSTRFIITCNYEYRIVPAIKSRFQTKFHFKSADRDHIAEYLINVLAAEKIKFTLELLDKYIDIGYPDIRAIVGMLQQYSINGVLQSPPTGESSNDDYKLKLIDFIEQDKWVDARKLVCASVTKEEYEDVYRFLYENLSKSKKFAAIDVWEEGIILISDHLYKHTTHADAEINLSALFIRLGQLK